jgi:preprotein translocase subunit SecY
VVSLFFPSLPLGKFCEQKRPGIKTSMMRQRVLLLQQQQQQLERLERSRVIIFARTNAKRAVITRHELMKRIKTKRDAVTSTPSASTLSRSSSYSSLGRRGRDLTSSPSLKRSVFDEYCDAAVITKNADRNRNRRRIVSSSKSRRRRIRLLRAFSSSSDDDIDDDDVDDDDKNDDDDIGEDNKWLVSSNDRGTVLTKKKEMDMVTTSTKPVGAEQKIQRFLPKEFNYDKPVTQEERLMNLYNCERLGTDLANLNEYGERVDTEKWYNVSFRKRANPVLKVIMKPFTSDMVRRTCASVSMLTFLRAGYINQSRLFDMSKANSMIIKTQVNPLQEIANKLTDDPTFAHMGDVLGGARRITEHGGVTMFHLGIGPFVAANIIMQVLIAIDPEMKELKKDRIGIQKIHQQGRILTLVIAFVLGAIEANKLRYLATVQSVFWYYMTTILAFVAGAMAISWLAQEITDYGIGEGSGMIITMSICASYASTLKNAIFAEKLSVITTTQSSSAAAALVSQSGMFESIKAFVCNQAFLEISAFVVLLTFASALLNEGTCKIPLQFFQGPDASQLPKSAQSDSSEIPIRVNPGGMTMIIAFSMLCGLFREQIAPIMPQVFGSALLKLCDPMDFSYYIFLFSFCIAGSYIDVQNTPKEIAEYITKIGARIPNVRPGIQTEAYLRNLQNGAKFFGGVLLGLIACICSIADEYVRAKYSVNVGFTSMLICTSTMLSLKRQVRSLSEIPSMKIVLREL